MDPVLLSIQLLLGFIGILGVATGEPSVVVEHAGRFLGAFLLTLVVGRMKPSAIVRLSPFAYVVTLGLLILVLFKGISPDGSASHRWLDLGFFTLQPSELMKVAVIAYLASFFHNHLGNTPVWRPTLVIGLACGLILLQPDLSTSVFTFLMALGIMFIGPVKPGKVLAVGGLALVVGVLVGSMLLSDFTYFQERITGFLDMRGEQTQTQGISYQAAQARTVILSAGLVGIGPGRPNRVPEAETDMVAVSVTQALGFLGIGTVITLFVLLGVRGLKIASSVRGPASLLAAGATIYICGQAGLNLGVAAGLLPVTGIPLPFLSYGLNSLLSVSLAMGFIHGAYRQARNGIDLA